MNIVEAYCEMLDGRSISTRTDRDTPFVVARECKNGDIEMLFCRSEEICEPLSNGLMPLVGSKRISISPKVLEYHFDEWI